MTSGQNPGKTPQNPAKGPAPTTPPGKAGGPGTGPPGKGAATPKGDDRPPQISNSGVR
jgi:hypothetical protein